MPVEALTSPTGGAGGVGDIGIVVFERGRVRYERCRVDGVR
jgi:hypothetical protein